MSSLKDISYGRKTELQSKFTGAPTASLDSQLICVEVLTRWGERTIVSVTYGVGVHARCGIAPACPKKRLMHNLDAMRRAAALSIGGVGTLNERSMTVKNRG